MRSQTRHPRSTLYYHARESLSSDAREQLDVFRRKLLESGIQGEILPENTVLPDPLAGELSVWVRKTGTKEQDLHLPL